MKNNGNVTDPLLKEEQLIIPYGQKQWPPQESFPLNILGPFNRKVETQLLSDINSSNEFLIITGFTSLSYLIDLYDKLPFLSEKKIKIALGYEPNIYHRKKWTVKEFSEEVNEFWLEQGISPLLSGGVINLIEQIKANHIEFRISEKMHAKLYIGDTHALLGSSNFSKNGLSKQKEANIRVSGSEKNGSQYHSIKQIAENFYKEATPYHNIINLLNQLLKVVTWPEALSRAISELIEGDWIKKYPDAFRYLAQLNLWPSQLMAIGQAIHILDHQGSALIADPTGSGKTKLLACLELALVSRRWQMGKGDQTYTKIVCPPIVQDNWIKEFERIHLPQSTPISSGILSFSSSKRYGRIINELKNANILIIDEAHNYLNPKSGRSLSLKNSLADCAILATATPINILLDIDNLGDDELEEYKKLRKQKGLITPEQTKTLRSYIRKFTVRRTKKQLNELIKDNPVSYRNIEGKRCRYPQHISKTYDTKETAEDIELANRINSLSRQLKGLINLQRILMPHNTVSDQKNEINKRLNIAQALAKYQIQAKLRSSCPALVEHLAGSSIAFKHYKIPKSKKQETGNIIGTLMELMNKGEPPKTDFNLEYLPAYLKTPSKYISALNHEIEIYQQILNITYKISNSREKAKTKLFAHLFRKHDLILAFDSSLITLHYLKKMAFDQHLQFTSHVVTGGNAQIKRKVMDIFQLGSKEKQHLALCSDAMSEGVNLQQASAVVILDMPSVLTIAEQRIGRLDRMDSPHDKIKAYWPKDTPAFALKTDRRLIKISQMADYLIGSNLELPVDLVDETIDADDYIKDLKEFQENDENWDGINDAFEQVRNLVHGKNSLIESDTYDYYKTIQTTVNCKVSIVNSNQNFGFFAFRGTETKAPKWLFIDGDNEIYNDLSQISDNLRQYLPGTKDLKWNKQAKDLMKSYLNLIENQDVLLLPNKKRRALNLLKDLISHYKKQHDDKGLERHRILAKIEELLQPDKLSDEVIDLSNWLDQFISIIQPDLNKLRDKSRYNNPKCISDLLSYYKKDQPLATADFKKLLNNIPYTTRPSNRIAACIVGIKVESENETST